MKKLLLLPLVALALTLVTASASAQTPNREKAKEELKSRATKTARKEARTFSKEGWKTTPGALPIDKQVDKSLLLQLEFDSENYQKYLFGEAMSVGSAYDGAKMQAIELAKLNISGQVQTQIAALVNNTIANEQLKPAEAETIVKSVMASKSLITQRLGRIIMVMELYRDLPNGNKEVFVRTAYDMNNAKFITKQIVRKDLEGQGNELHKKLDTIIK